MSLMDQQLQRCYDRNLAESAEPSAELRQIAAWIAAHDLFRQLEGPHSHRVHEAIEQLLLPGLRDMLRRWYVRSGAYMTLDQIDLKDRLSHLAGEKL